MYAVAKIVDRENCIGCKLCIFTCPDPNALIFIQKTKKLAVDEKRCKGCGLCVSVCPKKTLTIGSA